MVRNVVRVRTFRKVVEHVPSSENVGRKTDAALSASGVGYSYRNYRLSLTRTRALPCRGAGVCVVLLIKEFSKVAIEKGSKVTIKAGPLKGVAGIVNAAPRLGRFIVHIDFITFGANVETDASNLRMNSTD